jgi:uncharacterized membrane protein
MPLKVFKQKALLPTDEAAKVVAAIRHNETLTSGEIRIYMEPKNPMVNPLDRAAEVFVKLNMQKTAKHTGVLIYVATRDKEMCVLADSGINQKVSTANWEKAVELMRIKFTSEDYTNGLIDCVNYIGALLQQHFPYEAGDKNELPDNIVFG